MKKHKYKISGYLKLEKNKSNDSNKKDLLSLNKKETKKVNNYFVKIKTFSYLQKNHNNYDSTGF